MSTPIPPLAVVALRTELDHFRPRRPLLVMTQLRPVCRAARARAYPYNPMPLRGNTPLSDCLDISLDPSTENTRRTTPPPPSDATASASAAADSPPDSDDEAGTIGEVPAKVAEPDVDGLISKPEGEVGRLKRGYPLHLVLGWDPKRYKLTKNKVNAYVADYLNHAASSSNQPTGKVEDLTNLVSEFFSIFVLCLTGVGVDSGRVSQGCRQVSRWLADQRSHPSSPQVYVGTHRQRTQSPAEQRLPEVIEEGIGTCSVVVRPIYGTQLPTGRA